MIKFANPYQTEHSNRHTCEGVYCGSCRKQAWIEGSSAAKLEVAPLIELAIKTWELIEAGNGIISIEGLGEGGALALRAARKWQEANDA